MKSSTKKEAYLEGSLMPEAKFLRDIYYLALARYQLASKHAKNKVILDAGCGSGYGSETLVKAGAKKVFGIDLAARSIHYAQAHHSHKNLIFRQGNLSKLDFPDKFFDLICIFEAIEHIKNYQQAVNEFYRVLKPGGLLIISTPNKALYSPGTKKPFYPFHYHEFYLNDFEKMLSKFKIQQILGQYIRGRKLLLYSPWNPKRALRTIFANLPISLKKTITRLYLKSYYWAYKNKFYFPPDIKVSDVYFAKNLSQTREFVAICQKPKEKNGLK